MLSQIYAIVYECMGESRLVVSSTLCDQADWKSAFYHFPIYQWIRNSSCTALVWLSHFEINCWHLTADLSS